MRLMIVCILACLVSDLWAASAPGSSCQLCHSSTVQITGRGHQQLACRACHMTVRGILRNPAAREHGSAGCTVCHVGYERIYKHAMGTRSHEQRFAERTYAVKDRLFFSKNCMSCHLQGCTDCHQKGHAIAKPTTHDCQRCHKGYFIGADYTGKAPREDHQRYQRGMWVEGVAYLSMTADVHHKRGLSCGTCHTMQSMLGGGSTTKHCTDCHTPSMQVLEHRIASHMKKLTCVACHAAWTAQEYGTFYLHAPNGSVPPAFDPLPRVSKEYVKSAYLKRQNLPPLGLDAHGMIAPIRPQFISYYSRIASRRGSHDDNRLLGAEWKVVTPHTIQRGTAPCHSCHASPARFLHEPDHKQIYDLAKDGMQLRSFWRHEGQRVINGSFVDVQQILRLQKVTSTPAYQKAYVEKWKRITTPGGHSSRH